MRRVAIINEPTPWWRKLIPAVVAPRRTYRPGTEGCPLNRRVGQLRKGSTNAFGNLLRNRGKQNAKLCEHSAHPFVGRAADGTWCCYKTAQEALDADPNFKEHLADMNRRLLDGDEAMELLKKNKKAHRARKCAEGFTRKICRRTDTSQCCEGHNYPCIDNQTFLTCHGKGEDSDMQVPARGSARAIPPRSLLSSDNKKRMATTTTTTTAALSSIVSPKKRRRISWES